MKILYHHRIASKDGQYVHIEEIINAFTELGHEVVVVSPKIASVGSFGGESAFVRRLKQLMPGAVYEYLEFLYNIVDYINLVKTIKKVKPDFIYERYNLFFVSGIWARKKFGIPLLLEINAPLFEERNKFSGLSNKKLARWVQGYTWNNSDYVFCVTQVLANMVKEYGVEEKKILITPNGVNIENFTLQHDIPHYKAKLGLKDKKVLGFVGFVREWHGLERVVELLTKFDADDLHFLIVGDGPACNFIMDKAKQNNVEKKLTITGIVDRENIKDYIAAFDIALQPSVVDYASPLKLFEYMILGKAIVAPKQDNITEVVTDEYNALLFEATDSNAFNASIEKLLNDSVLAERIGENAKKSIIDQDLEWLKNAEKIIKVANNLVDKSSL